MRRRNNTAFSLIELLIVVALIGIISSIAYPSYVEYLEKARTATAIGDITKLDLQMVNYFAKKVAYPASLDELGPVPIDPWGNQYQYLNISTVKGVGKVRKDKNLVPINSDYDLYSMGPDGKSVSPLTAKHSRDDIVRGNNGGFIGIAIDY